MASITYTSAKYIIKGSFSIIENARGQQNLLSVTVGSQTTITVSPDVTGYASDNNARRWVVSGRNTDLQSSSVYYIYVRCSRSVSTASVFFSTYLYDVEGYRLDADGSRLVIPEVDASGVAIAGTDTNNGDSMAYYISIGTVSAPSSGARTLAYDMGRFGTAKAEEDSILEAVKKAIASSIDTIKQWMSSSFLSKEKDDETTHRLTMKQAVVKEDSSLRGNVTFGPAGSFSAGVSGAGVWKDESNNLHLDTDYLDVHTKLTASQAEVMEVSYIGGTIVLTPAKGFAIQREPVSLPAQNGIKLYWKAVSAEGDFIRNTWKTGDLALCQQFDTRKPTESFSQNLDEIGINGPLNTAFWWREVIGVGTDSVDGVSYNYIIVSTASGKYAPASAGDTASSAAPSLYQDVVQLGHIDEYEVDGVTLTDECKRRQSAIMLNAAGAERPFVRVYEGINTFSLAGKFNTQLMPGDNRLKGKLEITGGTLGDYDLGDLPSTIQQAINKSLEAEAAIAALKFGNTNLLRNSGFTGDYTTISVTDETSMSSTTQTYSPSLQHWNPYSYAEAKENNASSAEYFPASETGIICLLGYGSNDGSLAQTLFYRLSNERYVFTVYARKDPVRAAKAQTLKLYIESTLVATYTLTDTWTRFKTLINPVELGLVGADTLKIQGVGYVAQLQLEKGEVETSWSVSVLDNGVEMAYYTRLMYISESIKQNRLDVGGLTLTSLIQLGSNPDVEDPEDDDYWDGWQNTAGINGVVLDDVDNVAFWAGGTLEQAAEACRFYDQNTSAAIPTATELAAQARAVITHNGRAIFNDAVVRGGITAQSSVTGNRVEITPDGMAMNIYDANRRKVASYGGNAFPGIQVCLNDGRVAIHRCMESASFSSAAGGYIVATAFDLAEQTSVEGKIYFRNFSFTTTKSGVVGFVVYLVAEDGTRFDLGGYRPTVSGASTFSKALHEISVDITLPSGKYTVYAEYSQNTTPTSVSNTIELDLYFYSMPYVIKQYKDAMIIGNHKRNYVLFNNVDSATGMGMSLDFRSGDSRLRINNKGVWQTSSIGVETMVPIMAAYGLVRYDATTGYSYSSLMKGGDVITGLGTGTQFLDAVTELVFSTNLPQYSVSVVPVVPDSGELVCCNIVQKGSDRITVKSGYGSKAVGCSFYIRIDLVSNDYETR